MDLDAIFGFGIFAVLMYQMFRLVFDFVLRKKLINNGQFDQAHILRSRESREFDLYPSLKWGLVLFFTGVGLMSIEFLKLNINSFAPAGIILTSASLGFLIYFMIISIKSRTAKTSSGGL